MKGHIWILLSIVVGLFLTGFIFIFNSNAVRNYYFKSFKEGVDKTGILTSWIVKYPNLWFFKAFGVLIWLFAILIIILVFGKRQ